MPTVPPPSLTSATADPLQCDYFDEGTCHSCTSMGVPYATQVADKQKRARRLLAPFLAVEQDPAEATTAESVWLEPVVSSPVRFRNKAKLVVGGTSGRPTLGILNSRRQGVDLSHCALVDRRIEEALTAVTGLIMAARIPPYDIPARRGELKNVLITVSPEGELLVRFVLRSTSHVEAIRQGLPALLQAAPQIAVVSVNILAEHKAVLEGDREIVLTERDTMPMRIALPTSRPSSLTLTLGVKSFFQTNTAIAAAMYAQAAQWAQTLRPASAWDLYSGVGGFALAVAGACGEVTGVEISAEAARTAQLTADAVVDTHLDRSEPGGSSSGVRTGSRPGSITSITFVAADATRWAKAQRTSPDLVIVNPPRRGLDENLVEWLEACRATSVIYSSCNAVSLAKDLGGMPSWRVAKARLFDMFPQSLHFETMVLLQRDPDLA